MSAAVENLMYVSNEENGRFVPWHGLGTPVEEAPTSHEAIRMAGLDWNVDSKPIFTDNGIEIPGYKANTRDIDGSVLGIVSDRYQVVQNKEAFEFTDMLIGEGCTYETAGSLFGGKKVFLLARMPQTKILGDEVDPFLCFTNNHSGTGSIQACCTNVRVVCNNTLNIALSTASRKWSCRHIGNIQSKMDEAKRTLELANSYNDALAEFAVRAANTRITEAQQNKIISVLFPLPSDSSERMKNNIEKSIADFKNCLNAPDITKFKGTAWWMINAASDYIYHRAPNRYTSTFEERRMNTAIVGSDFISNITELCDVAA